MTALADLIRQFLWVTDHAILLYFLALNTLLLIVVLLGGAELGAYLRRKPFRGADLAFRSPLTPSVSVLMPAHNEAAGIVSAVKAMLALRYPTLETVVIDDGSSDGTFEVLDDAFDLVEVPRVMPDDAPVHGAVRGVYVPRAPGVPLMVIQKENGGRSDALNVGINLARNELVCMVDADSVLDSEALLTVTKPFIDDPVRTVATGGVVRVANGCTIVGGRVTDIRMPGTWIPRIQVVEYLRAFLLGRSGFSRLGSLLIISGAFGLFRRDLVLEIGGMHRDTVGEDAELVVRTHRHLREQGRDYRIVFVAEPVCWTEVPSTLRVLRSQRRRWHRGLAEIVFRHRAMLGNPRYGRIGVFALPYYILFELLAPVIELAALVLVPLGLALGAVDIDFAWRFLLAAYAYGIVVSLTAVALEEVAFHRYRRWRDLGLIAAAAVVENLGYRQLTALWRVEGLWAVIRGRKAVWGNMVRQGLEGGGGEAPGEAGPTRPGALR